MKNLKTILFLAILSTMPLAVAQDSDSPLCDVFQNDESVTEIYKKQVEKKVYFNSWEKNLILKFITRDGEWYGSHGPLRTFEDIIKEFTNSYDGLYFRLFLDKKTQIKYVYVWGYPGDNEYGIFYTTSGKEVGGVSDGDVSIDNQWCPIE